MPIETTPGSGEGESFLWVSLTANEPPAPWPTSPAPDRAVVKWFRIALNGWPDSQRRPVVAASGRIAAPAQPDEPIVHYSFPSGVVNALGDFVIPAARAPADETASIDF